MTIVRRTLSEIRKRGGGRVDWGRVRKATDADIARMIESDLDTAPDMSHGRDWRKVITPQVPDVRAIRRKLGLSQSGFAQRFGFSVRTVQEWEQGRAIPDRPARILLRVIEQSPRAAQRAATAG
jgi:putative transcriptional regulator